MKYPKYPKDTNIIITIFTKDLLNLYIYLYDIIYTNQSYKLKDYILKRINMKSNQNNQRNNQLLGKMYQQMFNKHEKQTNQDKKDDKRSQAQSFIQKIKQKKQRLLVDKQINYKNEQILKEKIKKKLSVEIDKSNDSNQKQNHKNKMIRLQDNLNRYKIDEIQTVLPKMCELQQQKRKRLKNRQIYCTTFLCQKQKQKYQKQKKILKYRQYKTNKEIVIQKIEKKTNVQTNTSKDRFWILERINGILNQNLAKVQKNQINNNKSVIQKKFQNIPPQTNLLNQIQNDKNINLLFDTKINYQLIENTQYQTNKLQIQKKLRPLPHVTDLKQWKIKNGLSTDTNVFIITGGYPDLKRSLKLRGWVQNPSPSSCCFDLKWTLECKQIEYQHLKQYQIVNHFEKNNVITTKSGLCKNLKNMIWINNIDIDQFYPKCFDLSDETDHQMFQQEFKFCKAQSILIHYMNLWKQKKSSDLEKIKFKAKVALQICQRKIMDINQIIDKGQFLQQLVTLKQWQILSIDELSIEEIAKKKHRQWLKSAEKKHNEKYRQKININKKKTKKIKKDQRQNQSVSGQFLSFDQFTKQIIQVLQLIKEKFPQYTTLVDIYNTWILKPSGLSRGRGISCYNNLLQIQDQIKSKQSLWVAQKYIQKPLIIYKRKFDIRQWVLLTNLNPLMIWFYDECYLRFSAEDYKPGQLNNKFIHLTNNAIASQHKDFQNSQIKGNMLSMQQFRDYLIIKQGSDIFNQVIQPQMKNIVKWSLQSAQQNIENRKNSHELFGYDFMIDQNYKVWLIQINSSPSMDYSTHITTKLVKEVLEDLVKVVIDYNFSSDALKNTVNTGKFKLLYKGTQIPCKHITTGLNLSVQGISLKKQAKRKEKSQTKSKIRQKIIKNDF